MLRRWCAWQGRAWRVGEGAVQRAAQTWRQQAYRVFDLLRFIVHLGKLELTPVGLRALEHGLGKLRILGRLASRAIELARQQVHGAKPRTAAVGPDPLHLAHRVIRRRVSTGLREVGNSVCASSAAGRRAATTSRRSGTVCVTTSNGVVHGRTSWRLLRLIGGASVLKARRMLCNGAGSRRWCEQSAWGPAAASGWGAGGARARPTGAAAGAEVWAFGLALDVVGVLASPSNSA